MGAQARLVGSGEDTFSSVNTHFNLQLAHAAAPHCLRQYALTVEYVPSELRKEFKDYRVNVVASNCVIELDVMLIIGQHSSMSPPSLKVRCYCASTDHVSIPISIIHPILASQESQGLFVTPIGMSRYEIHSPKNGKRRFRLYRNVLLENVCQRRSPGKVVDLFLPFREHPNVPQPYDIFLCYAEVLVVNLR